MTGSLQGRAVEAVLRSPQVCEGNRETQRPRLGTGMPSGGWTAVIHGEGQELGQQGSLEALREEQAESSWNLMVRWDTVTMGQSHRQGHWA